MDPYWWYNNNELRIDLFDTKEATLGYEKLNRSRNRSQKYDFPSVIDLLLPGETRIHNERMYTIQR